MFLAPALQRTRAASETIFLLADWVFREGYRRFEWKCDALNRPSRRAAERFGFSFEGVFRQATDRQGPQPRHRLVRDDQQRLDLPAPGLGNLARSGELRCRRSAAPGARGADRALAGWPRTPEREPAARRGPALAAALEGRLDRRRARRAGRTAQRDARHAGFRPRAAPQRLWPERAPRSRRECGGRTSRNPAAHMQSCAGGRGSARSSTCGGRRNTARTCWSARPARPRRGSNSSTSSSRRGTLPTPGGDPRARRPLRAAAAALPDALQVRGGSGWLRGGALPPAPRREVTVGRSPGATVVALPPPAPADSTGILPLPTQGLRDRPRRARL